MQQPEDSKVQPRENLESEIDGLWMLMRKITKEQCSRKRKTTNKEDQLIEGLCINKENGQKKYKIWKPRKTK